MRDGGHCLVTSTNHIVKMRNFTALVFAAILSFVKAGTSPEGVKWLTKKKEEEGVVTLPSGLMYVEVLCRVSVELRECSFVLPFL